MARLGTTEAKIVRLSAHAQSMGNEQFPDYVGNNGWGTLLAKLVQLKPYVEVLWERFDHLKKGETIAGCRTKKEFCQKCLNRSIRAVEYMLYGRTPKKATVARTRGRTEACKPETTPKSSDEAAPSDNTVEPGEEDNEEPSAKGFSAASGQTDDEPVSPVRAMPAQATRKRTRREIPSMAPNIRHGRMLAATIFPTFPPAPWKSLANGSAKQRTQAR